MNLSEIQVGDKLERIVEGKAVVVGHQYRVIEEQWTNEPKPHLVAFGGFIKEKITPKRLGEYRKIDHFADAFKHLETNV